MRRQPTLLIAALAVTGALLIGCSSESSSSGKAAVAPAVVLDSKAPQGLKIGIIVSSSGPGSDVLNSADGAQLAAYRLNGLSADGTRVKLVVQDDRGDPGQAEAAVDALKSKGVSGIVYASHGPQVDAALKRADSLGIPVLLPYDDGSANIDDHPDAWVTGASSTATVSTLATYERDAGLHPLVLVADPPAAGTLSSLGPKQTTLANVADKSQLDQALAALPLASADSVVIWGTADHTADVVAGLQRQGFDKPILASSTVLRPAFATGLATEAKTGDAGTESTLVTAGPAVTDLDASPGITSYLHSLQLASSDPKVKALLGGKPLGGDAGYGSVDSAAHDAVLLLVAAAEKADSTNPKEVSKAVEIVQTSSVNGLAGPAPSLGDHDGLTGAQVVALQADGRLGGPRSLLQNANGDDASTTTPLLSWYRAKAASSGS